MASHYFSVQRWLAADSGPRPRISKPAQLTCWTKTSILEGAKYLYGDSSGLLEYSEPAAGADLNAGFQDFIAKPEAESTPVEVIIRGACRAGNKWERTHVCTFRNNLNKICLTPASLKEGWSVDACLHNGTLYLDIVKVVERNFPDKDRFNYYGYKFEAICTQSPTVDATSEFASVVQLRLGELNILMAAEIDCYQSQPGQQQRQQQGAASTPRGNNSSSASLAASSYIELKTYRRPTNPEFHMRLCRDKYPRFFVQSFLAGVPTLVLGGRSKGGILEEVRRIPTAALPAEAAMAGAPFDHWQLLRFGGDVLKWMREQCSQCMGQHVRFTYMPDAGVISLQLVPLGALPGRLAEVFREVECGAEGNTPDGAAGGPDSDGSGGTSQQHVQRLVTPAGAEPQDKAAFGDQHQQQDQEDAPSAKRARHNGP